MEGQPAKRRRVYSLEPNKVVQSMFTRNYVNYLVPALMKIKEKSTSAEDCRHCDDFKNVVKYEVDMAMAFSAQGFAWSHGLRVKLQRDHVNAATSTTSFVENEAGEGSSSNLNQNEMVPYFSSNPSSKSQVETNLVRSNSESKDVPQMNKDYFAGEGNDDEDEGMMIKSQLRSLRRMIPGGEDMCDEQMVTELESYISCLQMQVNVLQCLLSETP